MKLIDRMVADSRTVALHHTAGLSTPQQALMALFSLAGLVDKQHGYPYKKNAQEIVRNRYEILYKEIGIPCPENPYCAHYYTTVDIPALARQRYGEEFAAYLVTAYEPIDFVWRLAKEKSIVLLDGGGFDTPNMSVRVSLANLSNEDYAAIGQGISSLLADYYKQWHARGT